MISNYLKEYFEKNNITIAFNINLEAIKKKLSPNYHIKT